MQTIKFIEEHGFEALEDVLGITARELDGLVCLDYSQIDSPKLHPVVKECRGLILEKGTNKVVFRSMERFFNHVETGCTAVLDENTDYFDKVDGSYIKIYHYNGKWYVGTRGTVFANNTTAMANTTFADLVYRALKVDNHMHFEALADNYLSKNISYNFEVTSVENRVVTRYEGYTLHYLSSRYTESGEYVDQRDVAKAFGAQLLKPMKFPTQQDVEAYVENLTDLKEGVVAYENGIPVAKIKNSLYVHVHGSRGDGPLSLKRIKTLIYEQDHEEYLGYFPEDTPLFEPYIKAYENLFERFVETWKQVKDIEDQKEFAQDISHLPYKGLLFSKRKNPELSLTAMLSKLTNNSKMDLLENLKS